MSPNHSYLPRKCLERGPKGDEIGIYKTWTVIEFQRVDGHFWFPKRTNMVFPSHPLPGFEMAIDEVILNEPLPRSSFGPPVPSPGTRVTDYQNMKAARIAGGPEAVPSPAPQQTSNGAGNIRANVPISSWTRWGLLGGALLMLGVAVRWWQRSYS